MNLLRLKARPLLAAPFIVDGLSALTHPDPHAKKVEQAWISLEKIGLPPLDARQLRVATRVSGALSVGTAVYFVIGKHKRAAAALLTTFTVPLALVNAPIWLVDGKEERRAAARKLLNYGVLLGGTLLASVDRDGEPSRAWKQKFCKEQRLLIATIKEEAFASGLAAATR